MFRERPGFSRRMIDVNRGFILITTLLFMMVITLLALTILELSLMQTKMQQNFQEKEIAFQNAENNLQIAENALISGKIFSSDNSHLYHLWKLKPCEEKACFELTGIGKYKNFQTILHSIYMLDSNQFYRLAWWNDSDYHLKE